MTSRKLPFAEFVALVALMFAMIAIGVDAMLPAFPEIAIDFNLDDVNRAQLVITAFILGNGGGQMVMGPFSDSLGRKPVIYAGILIYIIGCVLAVFAGSFELLLMARFVQGFGASAPRAVTMAMIRDQYDGRQMAQVMSLAMTLFVLVPAVAPLMGQAVMLHFGWRSIFVAFMIFAVTGLVWMALRQPETHPKERRQRLDPQRYLAALREVLTSKVVVTYMVAMSCGYGALFGYLSSAQQIYVDVFNAGANFPVYFAAIAVLSGSAGILNARLVVRHGMRRLATLAFLVMLLVTLAYFLLLRNFELSGTLEFRLFLGWSLVAFMTPGLTFGNLNALAMEPMGHVAGMAAAVVGAVSTVLGVVIAIPIGLAFNGTIQPLLIGFAISMLVALGLMLSNPKARPAPASAG